MALCTLLFAARVAAQALQRFHPQSWLPPFDAFQGSGLSYGLLLTMQLIILAFMCRACLQLARHRLKPRPHLGRALFLFGGLYMIGSLARVVIGLAYVEAPAWFNTWIPALLHIVLATFVLSLAIHHRGADRAAR